MHDKASDQSVGIDEPFVDRADIGSDLRVSSRALRNYRAKGILPVPDANLQGRDLWRLSTYRKFKEDLLAGKFALTRLPPHLRDDQVVKS
jgi:hypothetical protein